VKIVQFGEENEPAMNPKSEKSSEYKYDGMRDS